MHLDLEYNIASGALLDTDTHTIIVPNLLGNGVSFSPSTAHRNASWPQLVTITDNVRAQRQAMLLTHLGR